MQLKQAITPLVTLCLMLFTGASQFAYAGFSTNTKAPPARDYEAILNHLKTTKLLAFYSAWLP